MSLHQFRDRSRDKELSPREFHNYHHETSKERALKKHKYVLGLYYDKHAVNKTSLGFRARDKTSESSGTGMQFKPRLESERLKDTLRSMVKFDRDSFDLKFMQTALVRGNGNKDKWSSQQEFVVKNRNISHADSVWSTVSKMQ